ncbi:MAG: helix-turn-helix transcriptional regulator [Acidimicrobiia bacterium]
METDFGDLVRLRRESASLSVARLARLVGRSPTTIRDWERGRSKPNDPAVLIPLAAALGIDEADLFRSAGVEPPDHEERPTIEQQLALLAPSVDRAVDSVEEAVSRARRGVHLREEAAPPLPAPEPSTPPPARSISATTLVTDPAVPVPSGSYLEDPEERWTYRLRAVATAVGVVVLVLILVWGVGRLQEALAGVWEAIAG